MKFVVWSLINYLAIKDKTQERKNLIMLIIINSLNKMDKSLLELLSFFNTKINKHFFVENLSKIVIFIYTYEYFYSNLKIYILESQN